MTYAMVELQFTMEYAECVERLVQMTIFLKHLIFFEKKNLKKTNDFINFSCTLGKP